MRTRHAALLLAALASGSLTAAARAAPAPTGAAAPDSAARAAKPFEVVSRAADSRQSYKWTWITALTGAALVGISFPMADEADRRYALYLEETDPTRIDERFEATQRMDRLASGSLLAGELLLATAVWMRFVRGNHRPERVTLDLRPSRCALALRF